MNKQHQWNASYGVIVTAFVSVFAAGCGTLFPKPDYGDVKLAPGKTRHVGTLQLQKAEPNEVRPAEVNEVTPAEVRFSIEQCRAIALQSSLELKTALINPTIAAERLSQEEAKFESTFFVNSSISKSSQPSFSYLSEISGSDVANVRNDLGVQVPLSTGGTVTFDALDARTTTNAQFTQFNPYYGPSSSVSISQPLLQNAGQWVNTYSIRIASYDRQVVDAQTKLDLITVLASLDRVYWRLYAARRELEVRKQQHDLAQAQLDQVRRLVGAGQRAEVEIIRAEAGVAQQLGAIITAENNLRDRERDLKRVMSKPGLSMQSPTIVIPTTEPDPVFYKIERSQLVKTALAERMELLQLQLQLLEKAGTVDYMRNQTLPYASLGYTYNVNGLGATRTDAWDMILGTDFSSHQLSLQARIPIGNEAAKSRLRQAIYDRRATLATEASRKASIEYDVLAAADKIDANWQALLAARQNTILQGRLYDAEKRQFELGMRTSTDVLNVQTSFADSQSSEINALTEYQIALVDLAYATGTTLGADRIRWEPIVPPVNTN
jgi:outer membrane protein TolC